MALRCSPASHPTARRSPSPASLSAFGAPSSCPLAGRLSERKVGMYSSVRQFRSRADANDRAGYNPNMSHPGGKAMNLTEEQKNVLILMGKPDDGTQLHLVADDTEQITQELVKLGLAYFKGKDSEGKACYDLTDQGEELYDRLSGRQDGW